MSLNNPKSDKMCRDNHLDEVYKSSGLVKGTIWWLLGLVNFTQRNLWVEYTDYLLKAIFNTFYLKYHPLITFYIDYVEYVFTIEMCNKFYAIGHDAMLELHFHCSMNVWL